MFDFIDAYSKLSEKSYSFSFKDLSRDFPKVNSNTMYMFLMYAIAKEETPNKHFAICNYLYFMEPYIVGADILIKYHLKRVMEICPNDLTVLNDWVFGVYESNPDCPFSDEELAYYKDKIKDNIGYDSMIES